MPTFIRRNIKLAEAPSYGKTIFEYEENCHGAEDYQKVAEFIHSQTPGFQEPVETEDNQEYYEQPVSQTYSDHAVNEQPEEPAFSEQPQHETLDNQQEPAHEPEPVQTQAQAYDTNESQETFNATENIQDNTEQQVNYSNIEELIAQDKVHYEPESTEQPEAGTDYTEQTPEKPPIEIHEIPPASFQKLDDYTQISEDLNQNQQNNDNPDSEYRDY